MYNIPIKYEIVIEKEVLIDLDKIIEMVIKDINELGDEYDKSISFIDDYFNDNIEYYLDILKMIDSSVELSEDTLNIIHDKTMSRLSNIHPELFREGKPLK